MDFRVPPGGMRRAWVGRVRCGGESPVRVGPRERWPLKDRVALSIIGLVSSLVVLVVGFLLLGRRPQMGAAPDVSALPVVNAWLNATSADAYAMCGRLARAGFFVGQSSGAYLVGVEHVAHREGRGRVVTLFNDLGERYFSTRLWE